MSSNPEGKISLNRLRHRQENASKSAKSEKIFLLTILISEKE
jgi:hypothetical protein